MKKVLAILLAMAMCLTALAGCSGEGGDSSSTSGSAASETESGETAQEPVGEPQKVVFAMQTFNTVPTVEISQTVADEVNSYIKENYPDANVELEWQLYGPSDYEQRINLMMQSGEQLDLFIPSNIASSISSNQLAPVTSALESEYGQKLVDIITEYCGEEVWKTVTMNGEIMAVPANKNMALAGALTYDYDMLTSVGFDDDDITDLLNSIIKAFGGSLVSWYSNTSAWPFILVIVQLWKTVGYNSIVYIASITGIDPSLYEAARIDGASRWQQIKKITLPSLRPLITLMILMSCGRIFNSDFGLFYQVPQNSGALFSVTQTIDTYVYRGLMENNNVGMSSAVGLFAGLAYWNDWTNALYYIRNVKYFGIQNVLMSIMNNIAFLSSGQASQLVDTSQITIPSVGMRMALAVIGVLPILVMFPLLQKHLIKGIVVGAVKG